MNEAFTCRLGSASIAEVLVFLWKKIHADLGRALYGSKREREDGELLRSAAGETNRLRRPESLALPYRPELMVRYTLVASVGVDSAALPAEVVGLQQVMARFHEQSALGVPAANRCRSAKSGESAHNAVSGESRWLDNDYGASVVSSLTP